MRLQPGDAQVGDQVRIEEDEYDEMVGLEGTITQISDDETIAWVVFGGVPEVGAWCSVRYLAAIGEGDTA